MHSATVGLRPRLVGIGLAVGALTFGASATLVRIAGETERAFLSLYSPRGGTAFNQFNLVAALLFGVIAVLLFDTYARAGRTGWMSSLRAGATVGLMMSWVTWALLAGGHPQPQLGPILLQCGTDTALLIGSVMISRPVVLGAMGYGGETEPRSAYHQRTDGVRIAGAVTVAATILLANLVLSTTGANRILASAGATPMRVGGSIILHALTAAPILVWVVMGLRRSIADPFIAGAMSGFVAWLIGWFWGLGQSVSLGALPGDLAITLMAGGLILVPLAGAGASLALGAAVQSLPRDRS